MAMLKSNMNASINLRSSSVAILSKPLYWPWMYVLLIVFAELLTCYYIYLGFLMHLGILIALLIHSVMLEDRSVANLLTAMSIAPLIRILGLSIPLVGFSEAGEIVWFVGQPSWFTVVSIPMFIAGITIARLQKLSPAQLGLSLPVKKYFLIEIVVTLLCIPIGFLEYYGLRPNPLAGLNFHDATAPALILIVSTGFLEEVIFRGLLQYHATRIAGFHGILLISALFGALHITNLVFWDAVVAALVGMVFAMVVRKTGSIWGVSIAHGIINVTMFIIAPNVLS